MIREDRKLLADLYRLNAALASLALRTMDGSASAAEQMDYSHRLTLAGERLQQRATGMSAGVIDGEALADGAAIVQRYDPDRLFTFPQAIINA